jgi:hypothetical protein
MNQLDLSTLRVQATQLYDNIQDTKHSIKSVNEIFHQQIADLKEKQSRDEELFRKLLRQLNEVEGKIVLSQLKVSDFANTK